jgi:hypothetical protein
LAQNSDGHPGLGRPLARIAGRSNLGEITLNLIRWADAQEKLKQRLEVARQENPDTSLLCACYERFTAC